MGTQGTPHWNYVMAFPHLQEQNYLCILHSVGVGIATPRQPTHILSTINDVINTPAPTPCLHLCSSVVNLFYGYATPAIADVETGLIRSLVPP
ncbi:MULTISPECIES: hypothetical protein [unclassified Nodularia (in: cyanobacteria)]|uniref:hypothetical protein n=1 Tax=unclassified Nodularia (in: cyanobacteria) TaxID=2656917 RepID=UPI001881BF6A|nr:MULTISPECIES: hypothetical protein [unclassified Nodularia (in: cyanobacteria)]MBE9197842.1 hypothetical protein [Nodularia sp. LEGE 06071]MCC2694632.1 hypothetical protein [Nodularia sp. LEGE 04288]